jgi:rhodanese-related sulfurtransferase
MDRLIEFSGHHPYLVAALVVTGLVVLVYELRLRSQGLMGVSPQELIRLMNQGALVLDLRPTEQYAAGHISGARQLAADQLARAADTFKRFREKPVVVYCDAGSLGASAVKKLAAQGFTKVASLKGGLGAWRAENLPLARAETR